MNSSPSLGHVAILCDVCARSVKFQDTTVIPARHNTKRRVCSQCVPTLDETRKVSYNGRN